MVFNRALWRKAYRLRPEVRVREQEQQRQRRQRPEVKAHHRDYAREWYRKAYRERPEVRARKAAYDRRPEVRAQFIRYWKERAFGKCLLCGNRTWKVRRRWRLICPKSFMCRMCSASWRSTGTLARRLDASI